MHESVKSTPKNQLPSKQRFADTFRFLSRISYWIHLLLGTISGVILFLVGFSRNSANINSNGVNVGIVFAVLSLVALGFRVYWALRYRTLAKTLQKFDSKVQPSREEIIRILRLGLFVSLLGLFLAFFASEISLVSLVADAIARPQGIAVYDREQVVQIADLLLILAQLNILGAHFFGSANSLGLLSWLSKEEV
ncbi:conserved membrane hypothetical protein [Hyella patelloides LEGE 07179]|uniref:DUF3611 family protein n=1 Tax=Hyella patelloides LEGE 07179 TaxID=945734 RepID=A0A563VM16_9CYAN|nr:DUF3611 family protein [Hyella patelloides]VEP12458.1 conserved membrane hypothetical protein [Hyella patelloides LEGE 07179]